MAELQNLSDGNFRVSSDLTTSTAPALWAQSKKLFPPTQANAITMDISQVVNVDSGGLALLVAWARWANFQKKKFQLQGVPQKLDVLIHNNSLEKLFYHS
ncbi:MAG: STAS domain-containing protein [Pseudomonadota bacterium]